jgi:hypothetical protein
MKRAQRFVGARNYCYAAQQKGGSFGFTALASFKACSRGTY